MYCTEFKYRNIFSRYHLCFNYSKTLARSAVPREFQSHAPFFSPGQVNTKVFHLKWNSFNRVFPCPRLLYGALVSTNFWNPKHIGFSSLQTDGGYKVLSFIHRNYSSAYVLTSPCISRYWSGSNLAATQSSVLGWFSPLPFFFFQLIVIQSVSSQTLSGQPLKSVQESLHILPPSWESITWSKTKNLWRGKTG